MLTFNGTCMFTNNGGVELLAALPFEHDINLNADGGRVGGLKHVPPTLSAQWHFDPINAVIPYVGAGMNFTFIFDDETNDGEDVGLDNSFGLAAQAGLDWQVGSNWFLNADVRYISIETDTSQLSGDIKTDPLLFRINVGWTF